MSSPETLDLLIYHAPIDGQRIPVEKQLYTPTESDYERMGMAITAGKNASLKGDSPIGAVLVDPDGEIHVEETREFRDDDLFDHAEMRLYRRVQPKVGRKLGGCALYTVAEPCYGCCYILDKGGLGKLFVGALRSDVDFFSRKDNEMDSIFRGSRRRLEVVVGLRKEEAKDLLVAENRQHWEATYAEQRAQLEAGA